MRATGEDFDLRRFARLAAALLQGMTRQGVSSRASGHHVGRGLEFHDLRDYVPGDDIRRIDWRQSARRQRAVVRRFRDESAGDWFLIVDCSASVKWGRQKWPMIVQLSSALAYSLLFAGHRVALILFDDRVRGICRLGRSASHYATILKTISSHESHGIAAHDRRESVIVRSNLGLCRPYLKQSSNAFIISDFLQADGMASDLASVVAAVSSVNALQVLDEHEVDIPATSTAELRDVETGERRPVYLSSESVARAREVLDAHGQRLRHACNGLGIRFTACTTAENWERVLLDHLQARMSR